MAKSKRSESSAEAEPKRTARKRASGNKAAKSAAAGPAGPPLIDTELAAQSAARMLLARATGVIPAGDKPAPANKPESSTFRHLKESLSKPHLSGMDNLLDSTAPPEARRSNQPFGQQKQVGHNQTFSADVNRTGVPRRTPG